MTQQYSNSTNQGELERKAHETLQFLHDMRPDKAGQKAVRPPVPESRAQRLLLGEHSLKMLLLWQLRLSGAKLDSFGHLRLTKKEWSKALLVVMVPSSRGCEDYAAPAY